VDAWIKILVVLMMMSALSMAITYLFLNPFVGLILLVVILTMLVMTVEPATGKAMAQVTVPIILILFVFQIILVPGFIFDVWMLAIIGAVLYMMFAMFTGGGTLEGALIDAKISLKLFPLYGIAIFISMLVDPTNQTTVYIMVGTVGGLMLLYMAFLRNYDQWPEYHYGKMGTLVAISDINPRGRVKSAQEIWWARTTGPPISEGEQVVALGVSGLTLMVAKDDGSHGQRKIIPDQ
jgi:membrane-bound ClpP family serine protease